MNNVKLYYERQQGGLCRMHALNAFYQRPEINEKNFEKLCREYDQFMEKTGRVHESNVGVLDSDTVPSNQNTLISYVLSHYHHISSVYIPMNHLSETLQKRGMNNICQLLGNSDFAFVFNDHHIWGVIKYQDNWYQVDSLSGVRPFNILSLNNTKNIGLIIPRRLESNDMICDFRAYINQIKEETHSYDSGNANEIATALEKIYNDGRLLGEIEILLGTSIEILKNLITLSDKYPERFGISQKTKEKKETILKICQLYDIFLPKFEKKRNQNDILEYVPEIITGLFFIIS